MQFLLIVASLIWLLGLSIGYLHLWKKQNEPITRLDEKDKGGLSVDAVAEAVEEAIRTRRLKL